METAYASGFALTLPFTSMGFDFRRISELALDRAHTRRHAHTYIDTHIYVPIRAEFSTTFQDKYTL